MAVEQAPPEPPRHRRRPEDARAEILAAAEAILREQPFRTLRVDTSMRRTTLSRSPSTSIPTASPGPTTARDRGAPSATANPAGLFEPLGERFTHAHGVFLEGTGDLLETGRSAMEAVTGLCMEGAGCCGCSPTRATTTTTLRLWKVIHEPLDELLAAEMAAGRIRPLDPELTARALLTMDIRLFLDTLAEDPGADLVALTPGLLTIWARTLLLRDP